MTCEYLWVRGEHAQFLGFIFVETKALYIGNIKWLKRSASTATLSYLVALLPQNSRQPLNSLILRHLHRSENLRTDLFPPNFNIFPFFHNFPRFSPAPAAPKRYNSQRLRHLPSAFGSKVCRSASRSIHCRALP